MPEGLAATGRGVVVWVEGRGRRDGRNSWYAGVGTGWNATENFSVGVHYDYYRAKAGDVRDPVSGARFDGPKRSTALLGLTAEYAF